MSFIRQKAKTYLPHSVIEVLRSTVDRAAVIWREVNPLDSAEVFGRKIASGQWSGQESLSGHGSDLAATAMVRQRLPQLLSAYKVRTLLDVPCGDMLWIAQTPIEVDRYIGADVVPSLIAANKKRYPDAGREFRILDITKDTIPRVDLILCRDCLVHLSFRLPLAALRQFKGSGSKYLLTTTYPGLLESNKNIVTGDWRPIDLQLPPFAFPDPVELLNEACPIVPPDFREKSLGLWRIDSSSF